jgi:hypothetical protein
VHPPEYNFTFGNHTTTVLLVYLWRHVEVTHVPPYHSAVQVTMTMKTMVPQRRVQRLRSGAKVPQRRVQQHFHL